MVWVVVFSELRHYVVLYVVTNISNEFAATVLRIEACTAGTFLTVYQTVQFRKQEAYNLNLRLGNLS